MTATTAIDRVAILVVFALPIAYFDGVFSPTWTPRSALLLLVMPVGVWFWVLSIKRRDVACIAAAALVLAGAIGVVVGRSPLWNIRGGIGRNSGATFLVALVSCWIVGRHVSVAGQRLVVTTGQVVPGGTGLLVR